MSDETIFALATGTGRAAVAIIRVSGPATADILKRMAGGMPAPRIARFGAVVECESGVVLDRGLILWFPGPQSFTGEDCAEFQLHGSRAVVAAVLASLARVPGCRAAEPGEFTRRAFINDKLDLSAVEGLADLIDAQTEEQRKQALRQLDGTFGRWVDGLRERLLDVLALCESAIDFTEEGDIAATVFDEALARAGALAATIRAELGRPRRGERIREGFVVTIAGPPNAGKSTLLNALAKREVAIVSPHAGTTRDPIEVELDLGGYAVVLIDTAGIRETADPVEQEGVLRARAKAQAADLVLWLDDASVFESSAPPQTEAALWRIGTKCDLPTKGSPSPLAGDGDSRRWRETDEGSRDSLQARATPHPALRATFSRKERREGAPPDALDEWRPSPGFDLLVSAHTGAGLDKLVERLQAAVANRLVGGEAALVTRLRHRQALEAAAAAIERSVENAIDAELAAEEMRVAAAALGRITGRIDVEDILGAIFARFCIGK